jgi:hypothetical protein
MYDKPTTLERAFELARSGECTGVAQIRMRLRAEGYRDGQAHTAGMSIRKQLDKICTEAQKKPAAGD